DLDQRLVMKDERQRTEDEDDHRRHQRHDRNALEHHIGDAERDQYARHQDARRRKDADPRIDYEEQRQRPELERELDERIERLARRRTGGFGHRRSARRHAASLSIPAIASANSRAVNGSRSSTASPTPMK